MMNSSREEIVVKTRKPYTILKQREKWTEEEHCKFVAGLKLYGRAWQQIEEHISTKTAVQIRSHAQKFFLKLEKEAATKGVPFGQTHDIKIPPPRPKRKPSSPYPHNTSTVLLSLSVEAIDEKITRSPSPLINCKQSIDTENDKAWKVLVPKDNSEDGDPSVNLNLSLSSLNKGSSSLCTFDAFVPPEKKMKEKTALKRSFISIEANKETKGKQKEIEGKTCISAISEKNVLIDFMKRNDESLNPTLIPLKSGMNSSSVLPFAQNEYNKITSTFENLIRSALLQNPGVHAAVSVAASSFFPSKGLDASIASSSEIVNEGNPIRSPLNPDPGMTALAAATVATALACWATHGTSPHHPSLHNEFTFAPARSPENRKDEKGGTFESPIKDVGPEALKAVHRSSKPLSSALSSVSDGDVGARGELNTGDAITNMFKLLLGINEANDEDKENKKTLEYHSSCGSNAPSSNEADIYSAALKEQDGDKEEDRKEPKQANLYYPQSGETNARRVRSCARMSDSWKEVSKEGRFAFQALFSREVLPKSISLPRDRIESMPMTTKGKEVTTDELIIDLNLQALSEPNDLYYVHGFGGKGPSPRSRNNSHKRCAVEAKESSSETGEDEISNKRIQLEGDASIRKYFS